MRDKIALVFGRWDVKVSLFKVIPTRNETKVSDCSYVLGKNVVTISISNRNDMVQMVVLKASSMMVRQQG